jgi:chemotaxis protein MotB
MAATNQPIIVKKIKKAGHGHHGGAWKIAYADFVTAMMAFFLLLWLISMATPEQKEGLANYFAPPNIAPTTSGSGGVMGGTAMGAEGAMMAGSSVNMNHDIVDMNEQSRDGASASAGGGREGLDGAQHESVLGSQVDLKSSYDQVFHSAATSIRQAWQSMPEITQIADNLIVEETEDGLDIQIVDQEGRPMFPEGSKYPYEATRQAIAMLAPILDQLPSQITISGHTAAGAIYNNPRYGAWDLSSDRANTVRSILSEFGLNEDRVHSVAGQATTDPYFPNDPYLAANERIRISIKFAPPPVPSSLRP